MALANGHRIILKNEEVSLNGRMYRKPTHYWEFGIIEAVH